MFGKLVNDAIIAQIFPGAVVLVGNNKDILYHNSFGYHTYEKKQKTLTSDIFDLASLTKVIATIASIMKLYDQGLIDLDECYCKYLPDYPILEPAKREITVRNLITHCSGYPSSNRYIRSSIFKTVEDRWFELLTNTPLEYKTGSKTIYSDVNFQILGKVIESLSGKTLDNFVNEEIFTPLKMYETFFNPSEKYSKRIIPTEFNPDENKLVKGYVHDPNCRLLNGVAGHAGLFSTALDLSNFCRMFLHKGSIFNKQFIKTKTVEIYVKRDSSVENSSRALGWDTAYKPELQEKSMSYSSGKYADQDAIGHTGFTGTSMWISLKHQLYVIVLTNRVCPSRDHRDIEVYKKHLNKIASSIWKRYIY